jgi:hypothetical protein
MVSELVSSYAAADAFLQISVQLIFWSHLPRVLIRLLKTSSQPKKEGTAQTSIRRHSSTSCFRKIADAR